MKSLDNLIRNVPPGGTIVVKAAALDMSESAFNRLAQEIQDDDGIDDFDFVAAHRLGDTGWQHMESDFGVAVERPVDALTLRRRKR
jgi:hypothetical protein